jgi:hypothetical protein
MAVNKGLSKASTKCGLCRVAISQVKMLDFLVSLLIDQINSLAVLQIHLESRIVTE